MLINDLQAVAVDNSRDWGVAFRQGRSVRKRLNHYKPKREISVGTLPLWSL